MNRQSLWQFVQFCIVGLFAFFVDVGVLLGLGELGVSLFVGRIFSFLSAATTTWILNRRFTFSLAVSQSQKSRRREYTQYMSAMLIGGLMNYTVFAALIFWLPLFAAHPTLAVIGGTLAGLGFNFFVSKRLIFRGHATVDT